MAKYYFNYSNASGGVKDVMKNGIYLHYYFFNLIGGEIK